MLTMRFPEVPTRAGVAFTETNEAAAKRRAVEIRVPVSEATPLVDPRRGAERERAWERVVSLTLVVGISALATVALTLAIENGIETRRIVGETNNVWQSGAITSELAAAHARVASGLEHATHRIDGVVHSADAAATASVTTATTLEALTTRIAALAAALGVNATTLRR